jgi:hypothetical protein
MNTIVTVLVWLLLIWLAVTLLGGILETVAIVVLVIALAAWLFNDRARV